MEKTIPPIILRPPHYETRLEGAAIVFLDGPIHGAPDWQTGAIEHIHAAVPEAIIALPRRWGDRPASEEEWHIHYSWIHHHLKGALEHGVALFCLPCEAEHACSRPYAQKTLARIMMACTITRYVKERSIVVGVEEGFPQASDPRFLIRHLFPDVQVATSLTEACDLALYHLKRG